MSGNSKDLSFIDKKSQNKFAYYQDVEKNEHKITHQAINSCSEICFQNLKTDFVSNNENICLTRCYKKYLESLHLGEQIYEGLNNQTLSSSLLATGKFDQFLEDAKKALDL